MFLLNSYIFGVIGAAVNPVIRAASYTDQSGGNPDLVSPEVEYTDLGGADTLTCYGALATAPVTVSKAQLEAGSGGTGTLEFFNFPYNAGTDSDWISNLTATSNAADRIVFFYKEDNNGGSSDIETVTVSGLDFTAPAAPTAATNTAGNAITLTFAEAVYGTQDAADFVVSGAGATTVSAVTGFGTSTLVLTLAGTGVARGDTVTLAYTETDSDIRDANGNALANFSGLSVTNNLPVVFTSPEDLFGGTYTEGYWPTNGDSNRFQDEAKTTPATSATDPVAVIESTGGGPDMTIAAGQTTQRPLINANGLHTYDADDIMRVALTTRGSDMYFACVVNTTDAAYEMAYAFGSVYFLRAANGFADSSHTSSSGTPTYYVNGVEVSPLNRDTLHDAISTGSKVVVEAVGVNMTDANWATAQFIRFMPCEAGDFVLMENPGTEGVNLVRNFLATRHSISVSGGSGAFTGVTPSATGIYADSNTPGTSYTQSFAVENAPGVTALIAVHTRLNRNGIALAETSLGSATLVGSAIASASSVYLYKLDCPGVDSIELTVSTTSPKLDDFGIAVYHARDITVGTPQTSTTAATTQTVSITATSGNSVVAFGTANNPNGGTTAVGVTEDYDDTTWGGGDYMVGGHVDSVSAGAASYGFTWNATPGNSAVIAVEIQAA